MRYSDSTCLSTTKGRTWKGVRGWRDRGHNCGYKCNKHIRHHQAHPFCCYLATLYLIVAEEGKNSSSLFSSVPFCTFWLSPKNVNIYNSLFSDYFCGVSKNLAVFEEIFEIKLGKISIILVNSILISRGRFLKIILILGWFTT